MQAGTQSDTDLKVLMAMLPRLSTSRRDSGKPFSWRGVPEGLGWPSGQRDQDSPGADAALHARKRTLSLQVTWSVPWPRDPKAHDRTIKTLRVDDIWRGTTLTLTVAKGNAAIFFAIAHCSLELIGIHAAKRGTPSPWSRSDRSYATFLELSARMWPMFDLAT